jgi:hypothetical protein
MMVNRYLLAAALVLACAWTTESRAQFPGSFRLGNEPFRQVDNAPGKAYMPDAPTPSAYFRPVPTGDDQIGPAPGSDDVTRLAGELDQHLKMSYKHDQPEYNRRYVHFRNAMDEWDKSPKGVPQQVQMTQFLRQSIQSSMPGSHDFMPPLPQVNPIDQDSDSTRSPGVDDPFRDDPVQMAPM